MQAHHAGMQPGVPRSYSLAVIVDKKEGKRGKLLLNNVEFRAKERLAKPVGLDHLSKFPNDTKLFRFNQWKCTSEGRCKGTARSWRDSADGLDYDPEIVSPHSLECGQGVRSMIVKKFRREVKADSAAHPTKRFKDSFNELSFPIFAAEEADQARFPIQVVHALPSQKQTQNSLRYHRNKNNTKISKIASEVIVPEEFHLKVGGEKFLQAHFNDIELPDNKLGTMIVFCSTSRMTDIFKADRVFVDGTHEVVPEGFSQLFTMHFLVAGSTTIVPAVYVLFTHKAQAIYEFFFVWLKAEADLAGKPILWQFLTSDFERALTNAVEFIFPNVTLHGCNFHLTQAIFRHLTEDGLKLEYSAGDDEHGLKAFVKRIHALAFLPEDNIPALATVLIFNRPFSEDSADLASIEHVRYVKMNKFVQYLRSTWLDDNALYRRYKWNLFFIDCHRTNNYLEGWHHGIQHKFGHYSVKPSFSKFCHFVYNEDTEWSISLIQLGVGVALKDVSKKYVQIQKRLAMMKSMYVAQTVHNANIDLDYNYVDNISKVMREI